MTLAKGHMSVICQHLQRSSSLKLTPRPIPFIFHMHPSSTGGKKVHIFRPGHMTKMTAMSIYGKNLKNLLLQNHCADCFGTWYVASKELVLPNIYN